MQKPNAWRRRSPCYHFLEPSQTEKYSLNSREYDVPLDSPGFGFVVFAEDQRVWVCCCREIWVQSREWDLDLCRKLFSALLWVCVGSGFVGSILLREFMPYSFQYGTRVFHSRVWNSSVKYSISNWNSTSPGSISKSKIESKGLNLLDC